MAEHSPSHTKRRDAHKMLLQSQAGVFVVGADEDSVVVTSNIGIVIISGRDSVVLTS
jgi:hypothetical protein